MTTAILSENWRFLRANSRWLAGGFLLTLFSSFGQTYFIGLSGKDLREEFGLSDGQFGGLYMLATLASAMTLPWLGRTLDTMPGWKVARFSLPGLAAACMLIAVAPHLTALVAALYLLRLFGQGMMTEIAFTQMGRWFSANRGRTMAITSTGLQVGSALLPLLFVLLRDAGGWRAAWTASALAVLIIGLPSIIALIRKDRVPQHHDDAEARPAQTARDWTRAQVLRDPVFYLLLSGTLAPAFIGTIVFFHLSYLIDLRAYDPVVFAAAFPVMAITTVVFSFVCGALVDRFGALRLLPFFLLPLAVASATIAFIAPVWGIYLFMLLLGTSNGFTQTLIGSLWPEVYGLANLGGIRALTVSALVLSSAVGPGLTGALIDFGIPLPDQMVWMAGWCILASVSLALAARIARRREQVPPAQLP